MVIGHLADRCVDAVVVTYFASAMNAMVIPGFGMGAIAPGGR
jgi:hypothetical protein